MTNKPICAHCGAELEDVKTFEYQETQTVPIMKYYEDDAEMTYEDRSWTETGSTGYCPQCDAVREWDHWCTCYL